VANWQLLLGTAAHSTPPRFYLSPPYQWECLCFADQRHGSLMSTSVFLLVFVGLASYTMLCPVKPLFLDAGVHIYAWSHSTNYFKQTKTLIFVWFIFTAV